MVDRTGAYPDENLVGLDLRLGNFFVNKHVGAAVLRMVTPEVRRNIVERGEEFIEKLEALAVEMDGAITRVEGTGLLFSCELDPVYKAYGTESAELFMRLHGIGVIHGGENSLRFTPHFAIDEAELELVVAMIDRALREGPRQAQDASA